MSESNDVNEQHVFDQKSGLDPKSQKIAEQNLKKAIDSNKRVAPLVDAINQE